VLSDAPAIMAALQRIEDAVASLRVRVGTLEGRAALASAGLGAGTSAVVYAMIQGAIWAAQRSGG